MTVYYVSELYTRWNGQKRWTRVASFDNVGDAERCADDCECDAIEAIMIEVVEL
jgi:hypothetical protein